VSVSRLANLLEQPVAADFNPPPRPVWHCTVSNDAEDPVLPDEQWGDHDAATGDALAAGTDWWRLGEQLPLHPQAAYEVPATVARIRAAAALLDDDVWIAVRLPGDYEGADELDDDVATSRWTSVVTHPDELGWLREALQLRADDDENGLDF
jgi:hypothetical protein